MRRSAGLIVGLDSTILHDALKGWRYPLEIIACAVWACHRFALITADGKDFFADRSMTVSRETIERWLNHFGRHFADCIKRDRQGAVDKWHLDEVVILIKCRNYWLWRAVDASGDVLEKLVQPQRNAKAARESVFISNQK